LIIHTLLPVKAHPSQVFKRFGAPKTELNLKYRSGLELALAKADVLNNPNINLVQALIIFICLSRGSESPRYVWLLTGLVIRMAQSLGLQRDGSHFERLAPYEIQMRRRIWWLVLTLDLAASEDQGLDLVVPNDSFDTKLPLNLNDVDIGTETKQMPQGLEGVTDMSITRIYFGTSQIVRQLMTSSQGNGASSLQEQSHLLDDYYQMYEKEYLQYTDPKDLAHCFSVNAARITMSKLTLIAFLPVLFSSPSEQFTNETRDKLFVSAIEVAEYNHSLHIEQAYSKWRWICQTYTHWHAIVFLLIEISRRPWSCIVERAWVALQSPWLIPARSVAGKDPRTWIPLQRLIAKSRKHREAELDRLRGNTRIAIQLEEEDRKIPLPSSIGLIPSSPGIDGNRTRWRQLVSLPEGAPEVNISGQTHQMQTLFNVGPRQSTARVTDVDASSPQTESTRAVADLSLGFGSIPWPWADTDLSVGTPAGAGGEPADDHMDLGPDVNWHSWIESATGMSADERSDG
jgi:hypothetical protein